MDEEKKTPETEIPVNEASETELPEAETSAEETVKEPEEKPEKRKKDSKKSAAQLEAVTAERDALKAKLDEARNDHLRTLAEYDNYRKRTAREHDEIYPNATASAVEKLLPALDAFQRGMEAPCSDENFKKGMSMVEKQFQTALEKLNCTPFGEVGDAFDPSLHNAIMKDEEEGENDGPVITQVFQQGYRIGDKIVRFAMVKVRD